MKTQIGADVLHSTGGNDWHVPLVAQQVTLSAAGEKQKPNGETSPTAPHHAQPSLALCWAQSVDVSSAGHADVIGTHFWEVVSQVWPFAASQHSSQQHAELEGHETTPLGGATLPAVAATQIAIGNARRRDCIPAPANLRLPAWAAKGDTAVVVRRVCDNEHAHLRHARRRVGTTNLSCRVETAAGVAAVGGRVGRAWRTALNAVVRDIEARAR